tara:strand:- start:551 stop:1546 length:996 start_codon:yes stop_codon:yes gene_type:complete
MANFYGSFIGYGAGGGGASYMYPKEGAGYVLHDEGIERVSMADDVTRTDWGNMATGIGSTGRQAVGGNSSATHAFASGGYGPGEYTPNTTDVVETVAFAAGGTMVDAGDLPHHIRDVACCSSETYGYLHGGSRAANDPSGGATKYNSIWRFEFAASITTTDLGNLTTPDGSSLARPTGQTDIAGGYGYCSGGYDGVNNNVIQRYEMSAGASALDVGDMASGHTMGASGTSSETHGFVFGTYDGGSSKIISKFLFASSANATGNADSTTYFFQCTGFSNPSYGYHAGGGTGSTHHQNIVTKYATASETNAVASGTMTQSAGYMGPTSCEASI